MFCPPNEPIHAYLPPILNWGKFARGQKIYFHESAIKAIAGAKLGTHSIGLNGVFGWGSQKHEIRLLGEIRDLPWKQLELQPVVVFDSNAADNVHVQFAIAKLAATLFEFGSKRARHLLLPKSGDGQDRGFDDFVVTEGAEAGLAFLEQDGSEIAVSELELLKIKLNSEVCVVRSMPGRIAEQETGVVMTRSAFTDVNYAHYTVMSEDENPKQINVPREWLKDERKTTVENIDYMPGKPQIFENKLNIWHGMGVDRKTGEIKPWLDLLENNVQDEKLRIFILRWLAFPLQNLGEKLTTFLHISGPAGAGKNAILLPFRKIYGDDNYVEIGLKNIASNFTSIYAQKQFLNIDEVHASSPQESLSIYNTLKHLTTSEKIIVNTKGVPEYAVRNCVNVVTTSNYIDSLRIESGDRRTVAVPFSPIIDRKNDRKFWGEYFAWNEGDGPSFLYDYLLRYDLGDFDPKGWAPDSTYKEEVIDSGRTPMERFAVALRYDPESVLYSPVFGRLDKSLYSTSEIAMLYYQKGREELRKGQLDAIGLSLRNAGVQKANNGNPVKVAGTPDRYWIIKEKDKDWSTHDSCLAHLKQFIKK